MDHIFVGSEALTLGVMTEYELRRHFLRLFPDVYAAKRTKLTLTDRTFAAWLWSRSEGIVCGLAASALHGADYVDDGVPIELVWPNCRAPRGVITRNDTVLPGEVQLVAGMPVTSPARTAFDIARRGTVGDAIARLDALARATRFNATDVAALAKHHPRVRGLRRIGDVLDLVDAGAQSPKETWLRLLLIDAGFPRPKTQIPVPAPDGLPRYYLDMGWDDVMVAVEYDGEQHRLDQRQYRGDIARSEYIARLGWQRVRVVAGDRRANIVRRVEEAWTLKVETAPTARATRRSSR